ncbi:replication/maintenance protein RepL [Bacillus sp. sid0103]|uniref:replication/maintenance protein RepL n=1 Tax=Bacillus sp. sid0103 TaxID=2856337 RepID=UPI001C49509D|nr:helix-turn-helix domain-containing protein [Bacillus sp. sid0103]MBV7505650.1 replication/maintenance protein RepL [Bacillus sp. sid0103]
MSKAKSFKILEGIESGSLTPEQGHELLYSEYEIINKKQREGLRKKVAQESYREQQKNRQFIICIHKGVSEVASKLTTTQAGTLMRLLPYMQFKKDGQLVKNGKPMTLATMANLIGKSERTTRGIIKVLIEVGALTNEGNNRSPKYVVNPKCHIMGEIEGNMVDFTRLYKTEGKHLMNLLSIQEQGFVYKLIPFINFETSWLAENPRELNGEEVIPLSKERMAELMGESIDTVNRHLKKMWEVGVVDKYGSHGKEGYLFNPDLLHRGHNNNNYYAAKNLFRYSLVKQGEYERHLSKQSGFLK